MRFIEKEEIMKDLKRDYLIKTFSRTKRKDYENYIINGIWHKLNRIDIQPITQQYVKRSDGKYALIDLYFPQINLGIEIDEEYHVKNSAHDSQREMTMEQLLAAYAETKDFYLLRVKAYESLDEINLQIDEVVRKVEQRAIEYNIDEWDIYKNPVEQVIKNKRLSVKDNFLFDTIGQICYCFGKNTPKTQHSYFYIGNDYQLWCQKLAIRVDNDFRSVAKGWINVLSDDWNTISESNDDKSIINTNSPISFPERKRIVFAKSQDSLGRNKYRFIGIFKLNVEQSKSGEVIIYNRVAEELDLGIFLMNF